MGKWIISMKAINYDELSYAEIVTFLKVAQTRNMTMAAKEMNISQPAVSKRIANFEKNYGLILFIRSGNGLSLTPAGKVLYQELLMSQKYLQSAFVKAEAVQAAPVRTLKLFYDGFFDVPLLYQIIQEFREQYQGASIEVYDGGGEDCYDLFHNRADLMICPESYTVSMEEYVKKLRISAFQFCILVSKENALSEKEQLRLPDLLGGSLTVAHGNEDSPYVKALRAMFIPYGFRPKIEHIVSRESLCLEILSRRGVGIASPAFWKRLNRRTEKFFSENIRVYPIQDEYYPMALVWRANDKDQCLTGFVNCFTEAINREENKRNVYDSYN